jgi:hypothetical protein
MSDILSKNEWLAISTECGNRALEDVPCTVGGDSSETEYATWFCAHQARYAELMKAAVPAAEAAEMRRRNVRVRTVYSVLNG